LKFLEKLGLVESKPYGRIRMFSLVPRQIVIDIKKGQGLKLKVE
jgi:hypothetical protein